MPVSHDHIIHTGLLLQATPGVLLQLRVKLQPLIFHSGFSIKSLPMEANMLVPTLREYGVWPDFLSIKHESVLFPYLVHLPCT